MGIKGMRKTFRVDGLTGALTHIDIMVARSCRKKMSETMAGTMDWKIHKASESSRPALEFPFDLPPQHH